MRRLKTLLTPLILTLGTATFLYLLWTFGPSRVAGLLRSFGWGFAVILPFQIFDHLLNAVGWRLAFAPKAARQVEFRDLVRVRIAGDGVNYLTPSATIAGEFVRPGMLGGDASDEAKVASVVVAKAAQGAAQALFVLLGLAYFFLFRRGALGGRELAAAAAAMLVILGGSAFCVAALALEPPAWVRRRFPGALERSASMRQLLRTSLLSHPWRAAGSVLFFMLGYSWGAAEVWLIAFFLGLPLGAAAALSIEFLSNLVDALAFMVPAKIGTQEAGKTAIFAGLGLSPALGFTLGLIRHVRELCWAGLGLGLYALHRREVKAAPSKSPRPPEPAARAD